MTNQCYGGCCAEAGDLVTLSRPHAGLIYSHADSCGLQGPLQQQEGSLCTVYLKVFWCRDT